jgi:uncharacterized protein (TIGR03437 family)
MNTDPIRDTQERPEIFRPVFLAGVMSEPRTQITDPTKRSYGFQMTARLASNTSQGQAGDFAAGTSGFMQVYCADSTLHDNGTGTRIPCPSKYPVQFIEHYTTGWQASISGAKNGSYTYTFTWTPPAAGAGNVILYVAANCGTGLPAVTPTNVYTSNITLTPAATVPTPSITNVLNGASYLTTLAANTYATVYGTNLSTAASDTWSNSFTKNSDGTLNMPTSLDGTTITVGGTAAYIIYVSPTQVNFIIPNTSAAGPGVPVVLSVNGTPSATYSVTLGSVAPSFFTWQPGTADYGRYLMAQHADYSFVGKVQLYPGTSSSFTTPAKPGESIILYATGFGPTSPTLKTGIQTDSSQLYKLTPTPVVTFNKAPMAVVFAGLAPGQSQVYQFVVTIPSGLAAGDYPLVATVGSTLSVSGLITVQP